MVVPGFPTGSASPIVAMLPARLAVIERLGIVWGLEARVLAARQLWDGTWGCALPLREAGEP